MNRKEKIIAENRCNTKNSVKYIHLHKEVSASGEASSKGFISGISSKMDLNKGARASTSM
jgi:hypothetical protein